MEDVSKVEATENGKVRIALRDILLLDIEIPELLFVLLSMCDAVLTSICLNLGGIESVPWMRGWGDNALAGMLVATVIVLYLKVRGATNILWFGIAVLFAIAIWNFFMLIIISVNMG